MNTSVRIGIDVGGTFTHAVAVDNRTLRVVAHQVVPTTHKDKDGVAAGILQAFALLRQRLPEHSEIVFLAHSTTQATNALLEGDVAKVGIVGLAQGLEGIKAKADMTVGQIEVAPGKFLTSELVVLNASESSFAQQLSATLEQFRQNGVGALVAAEGFSVDDPRGENAVLEAATEAAIPACATHEMSGLYGLKVRTRTAVLNASILPKMVGTALMTEKALRQAEVTAPLMVMRSDGGVMSLDEVRRRPVMTLLSGPAAGIAACLMFLKASDALFIEVGGTSSDICLMKDGRAALRSASIGGHPTYLRTLDSRTLGVAGGSMVSCAHKGKLQVGPRSAHLAGFKYCAFAPEHALDGELKAVAVTPFAGDPPYLVVENTAGERYALTTTCVANYLSLIKSGDYAHGNVAAITRALQVLAAFVSESWGETLTPDALARLVMDGAAAIVVPVLRQLIADYKIGDRSVKLIGGGGGAGAIVPYVAQQMNLPFELAPSAEVISAIGASLAMVRECLERNIVSPSQDDLAAIRREAEAAVVAMGADPGTVEVSVEIDALKSIVRATATGSVAFVAGEILAGSITEEERLRTVREASPADTNHTLLGKTDYYCLYRSEREERAFFGFIKRKRHTLWVTDGRGSVRLQLPNAEMHEGKGGQLLAELELLLKKYTSFGDAGMLIPAVHVVAGRKLTDFSSLVNTEQVLGLAREELSQLASDEPVFYLINR